MLEHLDQLGVDDGFAQQRPARLMEIELTGQLPLEGMEPLHYPGHFNFAVTDAEQNTALSSRKMTLAKIITRLLPPIFF